jgi:hypothetical protein
VPIPPAVHGRRANPLADTPLRHKHGTAQIAALVTHSGQPSIATPVRSVLPKDVLDEQQRLACLTQTSLKDAV